MKSPLDELVPVIKEDADGVAGGRLVGGGMLEAMGRSVLQHLGRVHAVTEVEMVAGLLCNSEPNTINQLDLDAQCDAWLVVCLVSSRGD